MFPGPFFWEYVNELVPSEQAVLLSGNLFDIGGIIAQALNSFPELPVVLLQLQIGRLELCQFV
jgi:hypothetical protein